MSPFESRCNLASQGWRVQADRHELKGVHLELGTSILISQKVLARRRLRQFGLSTIMRLLLLRVPPFRVAVMISGHLVLEGRFDEGPHILIQQIVAEELGHVLR